MTEPGSPLFDFVKTMAVLSGILLLAWSALRFLLPKLSPGRTAQQNAIEVLARHPLEPRKTLYVVRAGKTKMLIAAAGDHVTFLKEVELEAAETPGADSEKTFAQRLWLLKRNQREDRGA